jgi:hypothetical protein
MDLGENMRTISLAAAPEITAEMVRAGYAVIGEFDPDITCLTSEEAVHGLLRSVYAAMQAVHLGADGSSAIEIGLALRPAGMG